MVAMDPLVRSELALTMLALGLVSTGCESSRRLRVDPATLPNFDGVLRFVSRVGFSHGCPIGDGEFALASGHAVDPRPMDRDAPMFGARWSDRYGNSGTVWPVVVDAYADLAVVRRVDRQAFPHPYRQAQAPPVPGEVLHVIGYDHETIDTAYSPFYTPARVIRVLSDNLVLEEDSEVGSSGGCILNDKGEVVALPTWGPFQMKKGHVAVAVGVWMSVESLNRLLADARKVVAEREKQRAPQ